MMESTGDWSARVLVAGGGPHAFAAHILSSGGVRLRPSATHAAATPWLALHPGGGHAVLVQKGAGGSCVRTASVAASTGALDVDLDAHDLGGTDPVHGAVDPHTGRCVVVAHGGDLRALPLELVPTGAPDGARRLQPGAAVVVPVGSKSSQALWHPVLPGVLYATNLSRDRLLRFSVAYPGPRVALEEETPLPPGSGPRRMVLDAACTRAYVINELAATVGVLAACPATGRLTLLETVSALPPGAPTAGITSAQLLLTPDGGLLLASNRSDRGEDSLACFAVGGGGGGGERGGDGVEGAPPRLRPLGWATNASAAADLGWAPAHASFRDALRVPRDMAVLQQPLGDVAGPQQPGPPSWLLLVANQAADSLTLFRVAAHAGRHAAGLAQPALPAGGSPLTALQAIQLPPGAQPTCVTPLSFDARA